MFVKDIPVFKMKGLTVEQISADRVTFLAQQYWSPDTKEKHLPYDPQVISDIYESEVRATDFSTRRIVVLELSQYLENYVWPNYSENASPVHLMSVIILVNEKFRERVPAWESFVKHPGPFAGFLRHLMKACLDTSNKFSQKEQTHMIVFLNHLYNSIETDLIRDGISHTVSYNILECLSDGQLQNVLKEFPNWAKALKRTARHRKKLSGVELENFNFDTKFLYSMMQQFLKKLSTISMEAKELNQDIVHYCERFLELMIDLESQLPTRRFLNTLLHSCNFLVKCHLSPLSTREEGKLFFTVTAYTKGFCPV